MRGGLETCSVVFTGYNFASGDDDTIFFANILNDNGLLTCQVIQQDISANNVVTINNVVCGSIFVIFDSPNNVHNCIGVEDITNVSGVNRRVFKITANQGETATITVTKSAVEKV